MRYSRIIIIYESIIDLFMFQGLVERFMVDLLVENDSACLENWAPQKF